MRITRANATAERMQALAAELEHAARGRGVEGRVCGAHCNVRCHRCGATTCQCQCSPYCCDSAHALSSDPAFPIEPLIAPLVFELKRTGYFEPCWSCEGHNGDDGRMLKSPAVWFYSDGPGHLRLLASAVAKLNAAKRLSTSWRIVVTFSDTDNPEVTYAIEPQLAPDAALEPLQRDIVELARQLPGLLAEEARALSEETPYVR